MRFVTPGQMQAIDAYAIESIGIPGVALMENAGRAVTEAVRARLPEGGRVAICCGSGNNGGDGLVVARHLANHQTAIDLFLVTDPDKLQGDARTQLRIIQAMRVPFTVVDQAEALADVTMRLGRCDLIVDALLGTGLSGEVTGIKRDVIEAINASGLPVVAVDIPSGLSGENGAVLGAAVRATVTVTFQLPKTGFQAPGAHQYTGEIDIVDIGIPVQCCPIPDEE